MKTNTQTGLNMPSPKAALPPLQVTVVTCRSIVYKLHMLLEHGVKYIHSFLWHADPEDARQLYEDPFTILCLVLRGHSCGHGHLNLHWGASDSLDISRVLCAHVQSRPPHPLHTHLCPPPFRFPSRLFSLCHPSSPPDFLSLHFPYITLASSIPISPPPHFRFCGWGGMTKNILPPGSLSRSDVAVWRRRIHERRGCIPQQRNRQRGEVAKRENRGLSEKEGRWARNERRQGNGSGKGGDWGRQMKRGNVRGDRLMKDCLREANDNLLHQASVSNWSDVEKEAGGGCTQDAELPLFSSSPPSRGELYTHLKPK